MIDSAVVEAINAVASAVTAVATCGLAVIAWFQISAIRRETRKWETVKICSRYHTDPVLFSCAAKIRQLTNGTDDTKSTVSPVVAVDKFLTQEFASDIMIDGLHNLSQLRERWKRSPPNFRA